MVTVIRSDGDSDVGDVGRIRSPIQNRPQIETSDYKIETSDYKIETSDYQPNTIHTDSVNHSYYCGEKYCCQLKCIFCGFVVVFLILVHVFCLHFLVCLSQSVYFLFCLLVLLVYLFYLFFILYSSFFILYSLFYR